MVNRIFFEMGVIFNNEKFHAGTIIAVSRSERPDVLGYICNVYPEDSTFAVKLIAYREHDDNGPYWDECGAYEVIRIRLSDVKGIRKFKRSPKIRKVVKNES